MIDLARLLQTKRERFDQTLAQVLRPGRDGPDELIEAMRYSLLAPGKRMRPLLVLLAAEVAGGTEDRGTPAAVAVEMVHVYSLIHDDLPAMDDDDLRRGLPTCHVKYGEALAILAGDALLTRAFEELTAYPPVIAAAACAELARAAGSAGMVGGQVHDLAWEKGGGILADLESVHARKTGALFLACLRLGMISAQGDRPGGLDRTLAARLDAYGRCLGLLFQITDDLLDVEGTAAVTGKQVGKDAARGKLTYPGFLGVEESRRRAEQLCAEGIEQLQPLGPPAEPLAALLPMILRRSR